MEVQGVRAQQTRLQKMKAEGIEPRLVELEAGEYILDAFMRMGMFSSAPMGGQVPLSYADILAYSQATQRITAPWELEAIADMSRAFLDGLKYGARNVRTEPIDMG